ncbi:aminotransferase class III-fold pyridoxal phosphate-dependent enzyme [Streptomyces sp. NPDC090052]|uniref:aminotransferase class III-fold pyridoxal phosphate-dependent enzyme n=1 Tax=Streptomyces sp. NPDC090052 TaxID=3365931 RepID=UPI0037FE9813
MSQSSTTTDGGPGHRPRAAAPYPPYGTAAENDAVYARHVSASHVALLPPQMNIHLGEREGARVQDAYSGTWYWDCWRQGSKFNLGHRHPAVVAAYREAIDHVDAGNWALASGYRASLAEKLAASTHHALTGVTFGVGGADAIEIAVHAARAHTRRTRLVSIAQNSYHGGTDLCLSLSGISAHHRERYLVDGTDVTMVPFNDLDAMRRAVTRETAAVVIEPTPAQAGYPVPAPGYLEGVRRICDEQGTVMIVDETQTGLGSCGGGVVWQYQQHDVVPDVLTTGKGLGGGLYPISAAVMAEPVWASYTQGQLVPHESTYAGTDIGCIIASAVLDLTTDPGFLDRVDQVAQRFTDGFADAPFAFSQIGTNMGLRTATPLATAVRLLEAGVLVIPSGSDLVVPFRPVLTLSDEEADSIIALVRHALG